MTYGEIKIGADLYGKQLAAFVNRNGLPKAWFEVPDHVAIKCADRADFEQQITELRPYAEGDITAVDMDGRTLATVQLATSLAVGSFGEVKLIEVMQPRPEKEGQDVVGFEHMEFTYPEFDLVRGVLDERGVPYDPQGNAGHTWLNIVLNDKGQELKINNRALAEIIAEETAEGENYNL